MVAQAGVTNLTAMPPRAACATTTITAAQARGVSHEADCGSACDGYRQSHSEQSDDHGGHAVGEFVADSAFQGGDEPAPGEGPIGHRKGRVVACNQASGDYQAEGAARHEHRVAA